MSSNFKLNEEILDELVIDLKKNIISINGNNIRYRGFTNAENFIDIIIDSIYFKNKFISSKIIKK